MRKNYLLTGIVLFICFLAQAQSKVFKEISDEISSEVQLIRQDNDLVGYLVFTRLEKASEDSFNYKITIMDENLNDIGTVNFREQSLDLQSVAFEQDILCLSYLKSNVIGSQFKNRKDYKNGVSNAKNLVLTQFLNLDGKIIKQNSSPVEINIDNDFISYSERFTPHGHLKQGVQLRNISQKGFACFYGDELTNNMVVYDLAGNQVWKKKIAKDAKAYYLLTSNNDIYLLSQKDNSKIEGGYELSGYGFDENSSYAKYILKDKKGNALKVLGFDNDPVTGKPYLTGNIINPGMNGLYRVKDLTKGPYIGVFTINLNGPKKTDIKETFSYWNDGSNAAITERGKFAESGAYSLLEQGFKDYQGNTYFAGSSIIKRIKWGTIGSAVLFSPLIVVSPMLLGIAGTTKCKITDAMVLKQSADGKLSFENTIPCNNTSFRPGKAPVVMYGPQKKFYRVTNSNTKTDYVIVDDIKDIVIYNVTQKKVARTISHKDGGTRTYVYPAKEGHVMVAEYNRKEKYTRFSIEAL